MPAPISRVGELDNDKIVEMSGGNRFNLVIMAAARSREIRRQNKDSMKFEHLHSNVSALLDFQSGELGADYMKKIKFNEPNDRRRDHQAKYMGR
jgi:DNA-directed RNA polymerase subunit K/omega